jgi:hypothetical protein
MLGHLTTVPGSGNHFYLKASVHGSFLCLSSLALTGPFLCPILVPPLECVGVLLPIDSTVFLASPVVPRILLAGTMRAYAMAANQEKTITIPVDDPTDQTGPGDIKIDRTAPAGSEHSLGAQSVRDGRPATDDSVVEAMDEEGPGISPIDLGKKGR